MEEESQVVSSADEEQPETDLVRTLRSMQQQLSNLERKMDALILQTREARHGQRPGAERPFRERTFSKTPGSFDRSRHRGKSEREHISRGSGDKETARKHFYGRFKSGPKQDRPPGRKKPYRGKGD